MDTDLPLKRLFARRAFDLLALTGDEGAILERTETIEIPSSERRTDCVLRLVRHGQTYLRHLEFQSNAPADLNARCFDYNTRLVSHTGLPVLTTVVFVRPPGPRGEPVFRITLGGREINQWRFEWVKLWEQDALQTLENGAVGALVLLPLMKNESLELIEEAARRIRRLAPRIQQPDLLAVLDIFAGGRYTREQLARLVGRELMMESSFWEWARSEGQAEGLREGHAAGQLVGERELCLAIVQAYHPQRGPRRPRTPRLHVPIVNGTDPRRTPFVASGSTPAACDPRNARRA